MRLADVMLRLQPQPIESNLGDLHVPMWRPNSNLGFIMVSSSISSQPDNNPPTRLNLV
jgi:hypothetical protein